MLMAQDYVIQFRPQAAAGDCTWNTPVSDDFTRSADSPVTGAHDSGDSGTVLTDSSESWTVDAYIDHTIHNTTDGSKCDVTDNDGTTMTCSGGLAGGSDNTWQSGDGHELNIGKNWTESEGDQDIVNTSEADHITQGVTIWNANTFGPTQCACEQLTQPGNHNAGPTLRVPDLTATDESYAVRWQGSGQTVVVRECDSGSACSTFGNATLVDIAENDWLCACVEGKGQATEFAVWNRGTTDPSAQDPTDWGDADYCACYDDGADPGVCDLLDFCATATIEDVEPADALSFTAYADCDTCYMGMYTGSSTDVEVDNWSARDCT
jgi:hypothetical protein